MVDDSESPPFLVVAQAPAPWIMGGSKEIRPELFSIRHTRELGGEEDKVFSL